MITQREKDKLMKEVDLAFENLPDTNTEDYNEKVFTVDYVESKNINLGELLNKWMYSIDRIGK